MKHVFAKQDRKQTLLSGHSVACFFRERPCALHQEEELQIYMHLGSMSLSPYRPTMHLMKRVVAPSMAVENFPEKIVLEATHLWGLVCFGGQTATM